VLEDLRTTIGGDPEIVKWALDMFLKLKGNYGFQDSKALYAVPAGILMEKGKLYNLTR